jgi:replication factor C subunit 2/4
MTSMEIESTKPSAVATASTDGTPWVEHYRPHLLKDMSHQTEVVSMLQNTVMMGQLPPGPGKTSVALALCKELWHP